MSAVMDVVKARAPKAKAKVIGIKTKAVFRKAKDKVINRDQGLKEYFYCIIIL